MCGLSCLFSLDLKSASIIKEMTDIISHRGPDDEGFLLFNDLSSSPYVCGGEDTDKKSSQIITNYMPKEDINELLDNKGNLAFGHRRLSIVDISPLGHQPMSTIDGQYWIVFNGEIYNYIELRKELTTLGHHFASDSDTEVILAAYKEWGKECLSHFNGMFAFVIYNQRDFKLFVARDRFGIKPLYYYIGNDFIGFASEIKQFTVLPDWKAKVNKQRAYDFLSKGISDHTDETLFHGVFQLRGGEALELPLKDIINGEGRYKKGMRLDVYSWYQLKAKPFFGTMEKAIRIFQSKLRNAIKLRLRSDVPTGSCLSGGLDSSTIVCISNQILRSQSTHHLQKTFSACSNIDKYDERKWIDIVTEFTKVDAHHTYPSAKGLFEDLPRIVWHQDEPFGTTSIYAQWKVFQQAAKNNVVVMLDGQGADEQLAGYESFFGPRLLTLLKSIKLTAFWNESLALHRRHGYSYKKLFIHLVYSILSEQKKEWLRKFLRKGGASYSWLNKDVLGHTDKSPFEAIEDKYPSTMQGLSFMQLQESNLQKLLHWEDRNSMAHSLESRVPFLDYHLVEFVLGLPDEYKLSFGKTKLVLRESMSGILPDDIRDRTDKLGFVTPEEIWLKEDATDLFREKLKQAITSSSGILKEAETLSLLDDMISGRTKFTSLPWRMICFGEWMKQYNVEITIND